MSALPRPRIVSPSRAGGPVPASRDGIHVAREDHERTVGTRLVRVQTHTVVGLVPVAWKCPHRPIDPVEDRRLVPALGVDTDEFLGSIGETPGELEVGLHGTHPRGSRGPQTGGRRRAGFTIPS